MSQACRTYIRANLDMNLFSLIYNYKSNLSYAPMLRARKGVKRADMTVDSTSYFKEILTTGYSAYPRTEILQLLYGLCEDRYRKFRDKFVQDPLWPDMLLAGRASRNLSKYMPLTEEERRTVDSIASPDLRQLF